LKGTTYLKNMSHVEHEVCDFSSTNENYPEKTELYVELKNCTPSSYNQITIIIPKATQLSHSSNVDNCENLSTLSITDDNLQERDRSLESIPHTSQIEEICPRLNNKESISHLETIEKSKPLQHADSISKNIAPLLQNLEVKQSKSATNSNLEKTRISSKDEFTRGVLLETDFPVIENETKDFSKFDKIVEPSRSDKADESNDSKTSNRTLICAKCQKEIVRY
ncbi:hypothetical protein WA026_001137, partial [Henosepilachna vigintioctopunctata]